MAGICYPVLEGDMDKIKLRGALFFRLVRHCDASRMDFLLTMQKNIKQINNIPIVYKKKTQAEK